MNSTMLRRTHHTSISHVDTLLGFDPAYTLLYKIGSGLGCTIRQLLSLKVKDIRNQTCLKMHVGPLHVLRSWHVPSSLQNEIRAYTAGRSGSDPLFTLSDGVEISEDMIPSHFEDIGVVNGSFLPIVMKTYYEKTGDLDYPMHMMTMPLDSARVLLDSINQ